MYFLIRATYPTFVAWRSCRRLPGAVYDDYRFDDSRLASSSLLACLPVLSTLQITDYLRVGKKAEQRNCISNRVRSREQIDQAFPIFLM